MDKPRNFTIRLLFSLFFMALSCNIFAQVTVSANNEPIRQVIRQIEKSSNYTFFFNNDLPDLNKTVTINLKDQKIEAVLSQLFKGTRINYKLGANNQIVLTVVGKELNTESELSPSAPSRISGVVKDEKTGETIPGVNVVVEGSKTGVITDIDGKYSIQVPNASAVLVFSYIGYNTQRSNPKQTLNNISLTPETKQLDEVVVTAMGILKKEKSLTYSTQSVKGGELTRVKDANMINSLTGKVAGVQINKSSSGLGGSAKVVIRGNRSATGDNQPLYVIDGIPIMNSVSEQSATTMGGTNDGANRDSGDGISNINPDDIESMNVLKGPAAAALYGSQAANGVIVITTKKGKAGKTTVTVNSSNTFDNAVSLPELQSQYGNGMSSWGTTAATNGHDPKAFFNTGFNTINSVAMSSGNEAMQTYFSYANTSAKGLVGSNKLNKHNFNFRESATFFDKRLSIDANINLMNQKINNATSPGGLYMNPLVGLYTFPRGADFSVYQTGFERFDPARNLYTQNWFKYDNDKNQNPYWLINRAPNENIRNRAITNLTARWKFNENLILQVRGNADYISDKFEQDYYAGTHTNIAGKNGRMVVYEGTEMKTYGDALLSYNKTFGDISVAASVGSSITQSSVKSLRLDSHPSSIGLFFANQFSVANMDLNNGYSEQINSNREDQSVFATAQFGLKNWLFLDLTGRNDWSSTLAYTESLTSGFFYPSAGLSGVISDAVKLPSFFNYLKVRGAVSQVGNSLPLYISNPGNRITAGGVLVPNTIGIAPGTSLQPEKTTSAEAGFEAKFFNSRLSLDVTAYRTNTRNQLFTLPAPAGSGYSNYYINAGDIQNTGAEIILGLIPISAPHFSWNTHFNFAMNRNKVNKLAEGLNFFALGQLGSDSYQMRLEEGGSFGDIYGVTFARDAQGQIIYDAKGLPTKNTEFEKVGNTAPKFNLGWDNTFTVGNFSLYALIDGRFGGNVLSITEAENDINGVSKATGDARQRGYVELEGKQITDVEGFYTLVGGRSGVTEYYMYDATNIRLREVSLSYSLPRTLLKKSFLTGVDFSLIGRNLFYIYKKAPYDPDAQMTVGNNLQGVDVYGMPATRSVGFNVKLNF